MNTFLNPLSLVTYLTISLVAGAAIIAAFWFIGDILLALVIAVVIASSIEPAVRTLKTKLKLPRVASILLIYIFIFALVSTLFYLILPPLQGELRSLQEIIPDIFQRFPYLQEIPLPSIEKVISGLSASLPGILAFGGQVLNSIVLTVTIVVISFYLTLHESGIEFFLRSITPHNYEGKVLNIWKSTQAKLGRWAQTQLILSFGVAALIFIGLSLLGVRYAILLSLLAGLLEIIPIAGPIVSGAVAVLLSIGTSPVQALFVAALYFAVQQFESHVLVPQLMGRRLGLDPILVIIALLIGARLGSLLGMLAAVPLAMLITEIFREFGKGTKTL